MRYLSFREQIHTSCYNVYMRGRGRRGGLEWARGEGGWSGVGEGEGEDNFKSSSRIFSMVLIAIRGGVE